MSECTEPQWNELLGAYALGSCSPAEQEGLREHLSGCPTCTAELLELGAAREALLTAVPRASAPPELKSRVMTQVRADAALFAAAREREAGTRPTAARAPKPERSGRRFGWLRAPVPLAAAAACAAILAVGAGVLGAALVGGDSGGGPASTRTISAQVNTSQAPGARARLVVSDDGGSRLVVQGMPSPGRGRVYQVWLTRGGSTRPAGTLFAVDRSGNGAAVVPGALKGVDQVLVSSEPVGGSQKPTRIPVLAATV
jgi:Anti-sigma-K factor rskA/Putative zinc-finger